MSGRGALLVFLLLVQPLISGQSREVGVCPHWEMTFAEAAGFPSPSPPHTHWPPWIGHMPTHSLSVSQGEGRYPEGSRGPGEAGHRADTGGLRGHSPHLPDRVHALSQPVRGHPGRCAAAHQGEQRRGAPALHHWGRRLRLQETPPVSQRSRPIVMRLSEH